MLSDMQILHFIELTPRVYEVGITVYILEMRVRKLQ